MAKYVKCAICDSSEYDVVFRENEAQIHQIVKCTNCGLMYANPQKSTIEETYCAEITKPLPPLTENDQTIQQAHSKVSDYKQINEFINVKMPNKGSVLDIGAYTGALLNLFKEQGWAVMGLEPNKLAVTYAKDKYGIDMLQSSLEAANFGKETFDAIVMLHVIEHLYDPAKGLDIINGFLKQGGILVMETPTFDTLMFKVLGRRERSVSWGSHLFFFTFDTLQKLLERHGFEVIKKEKVGRTLTLDRLLWNIGNISKSNFVKKVLGKFSKLLCLDKVRIYINVRDMQRVYSVKKTDILQK
jgi:SAM-dependent methyltransferase